MKRLFTQCLLVTLLSLFGITTAWAQKSVLDESFASGSVPANWTTAGSYWKFSDGNAKFEALVQDGADTLFAPLLSLSGLKNKPSVAITYSNTANGAKVNELKVLYRASATAAWNEWKTFDAATDGQVSIKDVLPDGLANVQIALAGAYKGGIETRVYRLALENKTEATTAPTGLRWENLQTTSVKLWWDVCESDMFEQYNVKVSSKQLVNPSAESADIVDNVGWELTDENYELTGLTPNTEYWFYIQYDCGDGDLSPWAEKSFQTPCTTINLPYSENFESGEATCCTLIGTTVSAEFAYNSTQSLKSYSAKGENNFFILPELNGDIEAKKCQISFMAAALDGGNTYARTVTIGVCTSPDKESFTEVKTLELPKGRIWESIVVSLKGYAGNGKYIALRFGNEDKANRLFVDEIKIEGASDCPKPMFAEVYEITPNTAKLKWVETGNATEWNLVLSTKPLADPEDIEPDAAKGEYAGSISDNPYTATNLQPNTTYHAYLQAGCGSSEWTSAIEFTTAREVTYPYHEAFDRMASDLYTENTSAIPTGWVVDDRCVVAGDKYDKQHYNDSYRPYVTTKYNHETTAYVSASLYLRGASGDGYSSIAMLPAMPKAVKGMTVTFWAYSGNGKCDVNVGVATSQVNDKKQGEQLDVNIIKVGTVSITTANVWTKYSVNLKSYSGEGRYIVFYLTPGTGTPIVYVDDIDVDDTRDCDEVLGISVVPGATSANISWTDNSSATSWKLKVSSTEIDPSAADGDVLNKTVNDKSYSATGLAIGTTYYVYVSPACGEVWNSTTCSFTTNVGIEVPYYTDFSGEVTGAVTNRGPKNWKLGFLYSDTWTTSSYVPYVYTNANFPWNDKPADQEGPWLNISNSASASGQYPYAIMPELLNAEVKDLMISFYGYAYGTSNIAASGEDPYYGELRIGVVNSPEDISKAAKFANVTEIQKVRFTASRVPQRVFVDMSSYTGSGKYIVFYQNYNKSNTTYLDNLSITLNTALQPVSDVVVDPASITKSSASFTWKDNSGVSKWEVRVFDELPDNPESDDAVWSNEVNGTASAAVSGLNHSTQYFVYVRSIRGEEKGLWGTASFYTNCDKWSLPFAEDWESYKADANTLTPCFTQTANARVYGNGLCYAAEKTGQLAGLNYTSSVTTPMLVFPEFDKPINTLQISMNVSPYSTDALAKFCSAEIGVLKADGTTFIPVAYYEKFRLADYSQWDPYYVNFSSYTQYADGDRIAIRAQYDKLKQGTSGGYFFFDDVVIEEAPLNARITNIEIKDLTATSATINWPKGNVNNANETAWNLKVSTKSLENPDAATADVFDGQLSERTKVFTDGDLLSTTNYYVYVQPVYVAESRVGEWSVETKFRTQCAPMRFPYVEDFEMYDYTGAGNIPECCAIPGQDANHSYISTKSGLKMLNLRQVTKAHNNYFVLPELATNDLRTLQLSMQVTTSLGSAGYVSNYEVGVMTDPSDVSTFIQLFTESLDDRSEAYEVGPYKFDTYPGKGGNYGGYIAIHPIDRVRTSTGVTSATNLYIDNIVVDYIPTCPTPTNLQAPAEGIGSDNAKLIWESANNTALQRVRVFTSADADPDTDSPVAEVTANNTEVVVSGLGAVKTYYAFVRTECGENDFSRWSSSCEFRTQCAEERTLPYADGFEDYAENAAPECWTSLVLDNGDAGGVGQVRKNNSTIPYAYEGENALYVYFFHSYNGSSHSTGKGAAITPKFDTNVKDLLVYFDIAAYVSNASQKVNLRIDAVADNTAALTAEEGKVKYLTTLQNVSTEWHKEYIRIKNYFTTAEDFRYLRFSANVDDVNNSGGLRIDNIVFTTDLNTILPVEHVTPIMVTEESIRFSFVEPTPDINAWQVAYIAAGGDIADATIKDVTETTVTLNSLNANTAYDIYVRSTAEGDVWVGPMTVSTISTPASVPYITGFEDDADNALWNLSNVKNAQGTTYANSFMFGDAANCGGVGNKALYITENGTDYGYRVAASSVWATRNVSLEAGTYLFRFKVKVPGNKQNDNDVAYLQLIPAGATYIADHADLISGATRKGNATTNANNCYTLMGKTNHVNDWEWKSAIVDIQEEGAYSVAFYWTNDKVGRANKPLAIDSLEITEYPCTTPSAIELATRKADEVSIKWYGGKCKNFEYVVSTYAKLGDPSMIDAVDKVTEGTLTDGPQVTISNLEPATKYSFYVRTLCPESKTDWVEFDFSTQCYAEYLPYTETFAELPECWGITDAYATTVKYRSVDMVNAGIEAEQWTCLQLGSNGMAILPELNTPLNQVNIEIGLFNGTAYTSSVSIGVMDNSWDKTTFQEVKFCETTQKANSVTDGTAYVLETFDFAMNKYQGSGKVLALKNSGNSPIYVKYVSLTELPACLRPDGLLISNIAENSAAVNWVAGGLETAWEIKLNDQIIENVTENPYTLTGLEQGTEYTVAVCAVCDDTHKSEWTATRTFVTKCGVNALPLLEDFSSLPQPVNSTDIRRADLTCWDNMVSEGKIENVFNELELPFIPAKTVYIGNIWLSNWLGKLGDYAQLHSYHMSSPKYKYKWYVSPQYAIEGKATLSFDIRRCGNVGQHVEKDDNERFFVAISTDNGASWKKANATEIKDIDSVYTNRSISLDKYAGQNIRVAFYDENLPYSGPTPFLLIDNVRMNCTDTYPVSGDACTGYDYEGNGFFVKAEDLPVVGQSKQFTRFAKAKEAGCDSTVVLTLTTYELGTQTVYESICQGEVYEFGPYKLTEPNPAGIPYYISGETVHGCDSTIYLYLTVNPSDTTKIDPIEVKYLDLPHVVDNYYTVPEDAMPSDVKTFTFDTIVKTTGCSFNRYHVTITKCEIPQSYQERICEDADGYVGHGFNIAKTELPEPLQSKEYERHVKKDGCDSIITLTLTAHNDTANIVVSKVRTDLPYRVDDYYTVPIDAKIGEQFVVLKQRGESGCAFNRYTVMISDCSNSIEHTDSICSVQTSYSGYGFEIPSVEFGDLPAPGTSKPYYRNEANGAGCDFITLTLTVVKNDTTLVEEEIFNNELPYMAGNTVIVPDDAAIGAHDVTLANEEMCSFTRYLITVNQCTRPARVQDAICENANGYIGYGFNIAKADLPATLASKQYVRHETTTEGCDSIITLYLTVNALDTAEIAEEVLNTELPFVVDADTIIAKDAAIGVQPAVVLPAGECAYKRYVITVKQCTDSIAYADSICAGMDYAYYGFAIKTAEMPAAGQSKDFTRSNMNEEGCDSIITLSLMVLKSDTIVLEPVEINEDALPYTIEGYTIPAIKAGEYKGVYKMEGECAFYSYTLIVHEIGWGIVNITDDIDYIEVYDLLGRKIQTIRHDEDMKQSVPTGVYMLRTVMKSGQAINSKVAIQ